MLLIPAVGGRGRGTRMELPNGDRWKHLQPRGQNKLGQEIYGSWNTFINPSQRVLETPADHMKSTVIFQWYEKLDIPTKTTRPKPASDSSSDNSATTNGWRNDQNAQPCRWKKPGVWLGHSRGHCTWTDLWWASRVWISHSGWHSGYVWGLRGHCIHTSVP